MHDDDVRRVTSPTTTTTLAPKLSSPSSDRARDAAGEDFLFHLYHGSELLQDARVHEAKEELEQALLLQPRDPKGQDLLATVYFRIGLYPRAIQIYELLRKDNPEDTSLKINLALCYLKTGQPGAARFELEDIVRQNPEHKRAWGYLGLAYERLNELEKAVGAFTRGGHGAMARRVAERHGPISIRDVSPAAEHEAESIAIRAAAAKAFQELDAGELSFALAEPSARRGDFATGTWRAIELGQAIPNGRRSEAPPSLPLTTPPPPAAESARVQSMIREEAAAMPRVPDLPDFSAAPAAVLPPIAAVASLSTSLPANIMAPLDMSSPSTRAEAPTSQAGAMAPSLPRSAMTRTPPSEVAPLASVPRPLEAAVSLGALMATTRFPDTHETLTVDASGLLAIRLDRGEVAARLETLRAYNGALDATVLERRTRSGGSGEPFGGVGAAVHRLRGKGLVVVAPRPTRHLRVLSLANEIVFLREDRVVAFDLTLTFENGRVLAAESSRSESLPIVQLRGSGSVAIELAESTRGFDVTSTSPMTVRASSVLGWTGRLVPRAVSPSEAPGAQHALLTFAGEGLVLVVGH